MTTITLKNVPEDLHNRLRERAAAHHRSLNQEILHCLTETLNPKPKPVEELVADFRDLRAQTQLLTDGETIARFKGEGRP